MMELKKFEAPTLAQALQVVKRELGPEAVIISTKNKRSSLGLMNRTSVEVTCAVSPEAMERKQMAEENMTPDQKVAIAGMSAKKMVEAYDILSGNRLNRSYQSAYPSKSQPTAPAQAAAPAPRARTQPPSQPAARPAGAITQRRYVDIGDDEGPAEQASMRMNDRAQFSHQAAQTAASQHIASHLQHRHSQAHQHANQATPTPRTQSGNGNGVLPRLLAKLIDQGVDDEIVKELGDELKAVMLREHITREDALKLHLGRIVMSRLRVARPLTERLRVPSTPRLIAFVGPTGVGKTTTVAKIAAELVINQKRNVTLATADTFKIAAVEQLQTYANILRIPLEVCPSNDSLHNLMGQVGPDEVILIDTAGYGPRDEKKLQELSEQLHGIRMETHLCVSATTRERDILESVRRFKVFNPDYLVITKVDETNIFGNLLNVSVRSHLPLSYLTMGQRVPEDIEVASRERIADLLLNIGSSSGEEF